MQTNTRAWIVTLTGALFFFYQFVQLNAFNALNPYIIPYFHLSAAETGTLSSYFFYANLLFLFPAGIMLDRLSTRLLMTINLFICASSVLLFAFATNYTLAALSRFMMGSGSAFCFLSCIRVASRWFPPQKMAFASGVVVTMAMLGGMVAQTPFTLLIEHTSWRMALGIDAMLGYGMALLIWLIVRDHPPGQHTEAQHISTIGLWAGLRQALRHSQNWLAGIYTSLLNLPIFVLGAIWGMLYLSQGRQFTLVEASYATTLLFVGTIIGSPAFGWLSDTMKRRKLPMLLGAVLSLIIMLILIHFEYLPLSTTLLLFFLLGFMTSSQVLSYPLIAEHNPLSLTGTAMSIASFCIMLSGAIAQPLFGWFIGRHWQHQFLTDGTPLYLQSDYHYAIWLMPAAFTIALVLCFFIKETHCQSHSV